MFQGFRRKDMLAGRFIRAVSSSSGTALVLFLLLPAATLFCWQWISPDVPAEGSGIRDSAPELEPRGKLQLRAELAAADLRPVSNPRFQQRSGSPEDPFLSTAAREMLLARGDPFVLAHLSGVNEGMLVARTDAQGVRTLRVPVISAGAFRISESEMLRALKTGFGGSFPNFFSRVFGEEEMDRTASREGRESPDASEDNPFQRAREALAEKPAPARAEAVAEKAPADPPPTQPAPPADPAPQETKPAAPPAPPAASLGTISPVRPHLLMRVVDDGVLQATTVSQPRPGSLEAAELGVRDYALLAFNDIADFPIAAAVADFNGDGHPDVAVHVSPQGLLRFMYGSADGSFSEELRIDVGAGPRSVAAGDFNRDGRMDIAVSTIGVGPLVVLYAESGASYSFKFHWLEAYRDYILAADTRGTGAPDILGMSFANRAEVLIDFGGRGGHGSPLRFAYSPALNYDLTTSKGRSARTSSVLMGRHLSVNIDNRLNQMVNVLNVHAVGNIHVVAGDLFNLGSIAAGIAIPRH